MKHREIASKGVVVADKVGQGQRHGIIKGRRRHQHKERFMQTGEAHPSLQVALYTTPYATSSQRFLGRHARRTTMQASRMFQG